MSPYECYLLYVALKQHFTTESYDFFKYNAKVRASEKTYNKRKDRFFFERLSRTKSKQEIIDYFVSSFISNPDCSKVWVGELKEDGEKNYQYWKQRIEKLKEWFLFDLKYITDNWHLYEAIKFENTKHPPIIKLYLKEEITSETLTILDDILGFIPESEYDPIVKMIKFKTKKYRPFLKFDKQEYKEIIKQCYAKT